MNTTIHHPPGLIWVACLNDSVIYHSFNFVSVRFLSNPTALYNLDSVCQQIYCKIGRRRILNIIRISDIVCCILPLRTINIKSPSLKESFTFTKSHSLININTMSIIAIIYFVLIISSNFLLIISSTFFIFKNGIKYTKMQVIFYTTPTLPAGQIETFFE